MKNLKIGDTVVLKSGSMHMAVCNVRIDDGIVETVFATNEGIVRDAFHHDELYKIVHEEIEP